MLNLELDSDNAGCFIQTHTSGPPGCSCCCSSLMHEGEEKQGGGGRRHQENRPPVGLGSAPALV